MRNLALAILARAGLGGPPGGGPNLRSRLCGLPARIRTDHLLRVPLYVACSVQRVGIRACGAMRTQSVFRDRASAGATSLPAVSPDLFIKLIQLDDLAVDQRHPAVHAARQFHVVG